MKPSVNGASILPSAGLIFPTGTVGHLTRRAEVREFDAPIKGGFVMRLQRRARFLVFKYFYAPFMRTTWSNQVEFNNLSVGIGYALSTLEARVFELEARIRQLEGKPSGE